MDVSELLAQCMNQYLRKSIDTAISRFEGSDIKYVVVRFQDVFFFFESIQ